MNIAEVNGRRQAMVDNLDWAVVHRDEFGYEQFRPMLLPPYRALPAGFATDCSGFATLMCMWSHVVDPSGFGFGGWGNSDTIDWQLNSIPLSATWRGDMVVYGPIGATQHVAVLIQGGVKFDDPMVVSHGGPAGPTLMKVSDLNSSFPHTLISYKQLIPGNV
jgi:hypothetical protein